MIPIMCIAQSGQIEPRVESELKAELQTFANRAFGTSACINWIEVPGGNGFTAGLPSSTFIASLQSNKPLHQSERVILLKELADFCIQRTNLTDNEVVTAIRDPQE